MAAKHHSSGSDGVSPLSAESSADGASSTALLARLMQRRLALHAAAGTGVAEDHAVAALFDAEDAILIQASDDKSQIAAEQLRILLARVKLASDDAVDGEIWHNIETVLAVQERRLRLASGTIGALLPIAEAHLAAILLGNAETMRDENGELIPDLGTLDPDRMGEAALISGAIKLGASYFGSESSSNSDAPPLSSL